MVPPVDALDPAAYVSAMGSAAGVLAAHADALDLLDSDGALADHAGADRAGASRPTGPASISVGGTGSELASTLSAAVAAAEGSTDFASVSSAMVTAASGAATGRAGRALSTFLEGMGEAFTNADRIDATRFALGLEAGAERLAPRDDGRHPGGFASVANAAADAALDSADRGSELGETILAAAGAGIEELERGPVLDARLAARGAVDSSAAGLLLVLDSLASVVTGEPLPEPPAPAATVPGDTFRGVTAGQGPASGHPGAPPRYEVGCNLLAGDCGIEAEADLEVQLAGLCEEYRIDRLASQGWAVVAVTTSPGAVVELMAGSGTMREVRIGVMTPQRDAEAGEPLVGADG